MTAELIEDLEALINEKDPDKISKLKQSITNSLASDRKDLMQRVNMYIDVPGKDTRDGLENMIKQLKKQDREEKE